MPGVHEPVLLSEVLEYIKVEDGNWYLDATLGDGGHSLEILKHGGRVIGLDVDPDSLVIAVKRFQEEGIDPSKYKLIQSNFRDLQQIQAEQQAEVKINSVIFDLGVSSRELDSPGRGFSFLKNGPLDMRMDPNLGVTAKDLINGLTKGELYELFSKLGEEKLAKRFSEAVVRAREIKAVETTEELARIIERSAGGRQGKIHPATRVFQALRIAVNDELYALEEAMPQALEVVEVGGRILVISFHSLEDRIVKNVFREWEENGLGMIITKKPIVPTEQEIMINSRSRSAKLRVFEKTSSSGIKKALSL